MGKDKLAVGIFDKARSKVCKYHIEAFLLHMIAVDFIGLEKRGDKLKWSIARQRSSTFNVGASFELNEARTNVNTFAANYKYTQTLN